MPCLSPVRLPAALSAISFTCAFNLITLPRTASQSHTLEFSQPIERETTGGETQTAGPANASEVGDPKTASLMKVSYT